MQHQLFMLANHVGLLQAFGFMMCASISFFCLTAFLSKLQHDVVFHLRICCQLLSLWQVLMLSVIV